MTLFCKYFLLFMIYSFFGWVMEMIVCYIPVIMSELFQEGKRLKFQYAK